MRYKDSPEQATYFKTASTNGDLQQAFTGLDVLSSTAWNINKNVFRVVLQAWNSGEAVADIPASPDQADYKLPPKLAGHVEPEERAKYINAVRNITAQMKKDHGERCKHNYGLEISRAVSRSTFFLDQIPTMLIYHNWYLSF